MRRSAELKWGNALGHLGEEKVGGGVDSLSPSRIECFGANG